MAAPIVKAEGLRKDYKLPGETIRALKGVDLSAAAGEFVCVMGPSGAGKTTLLNIIGLLDTPTSGRLELDGKTIKNGSLDVRWRRDFIGFVFQDFYLIPSLTARENVMLGAAFGKREDDADRLLSLVGLTDRASHYPRELSGGEMQRTAIARALYGGPRLILADEPTGNLDTKNSGHIFDLLAGLVRSKGIAVIAATHNVRLARKAGRIINLQAGEVVGEEFVTDG